LTEALDIPNKVFLSPSTVTAGSQFQTDQTLPFTHSSIQHHNHSHAEYDICYFGKGNILNT